jgi:hypothetical protein
MTSRTDPKASFPEEVWNGSSFNNPLAQTFLDPGPSDYARISAEVIATQTYLATPFTYLDFDSETNSNPPHREGRIFYDSEEKTFGIYNNESEVTLQLGQEIYIRATNVTGSTISNGKLCYVDGAQGNRPTIDLACANSPATARVLAITTHDIEHNATGFLTVIGLVRGLDTSAFDEGDTLWLSGSDPGDFVNTEPTAPNFPIQIGTVIRKNAEEGTIMVHMGPTDVVGTMVIQDLDINTDLDVGGDSTFSGDLLFIGNGSGLAFAEINVNENPTATTFTGTGEANRVQFAYFDTDGESNNATPDHTENHITITKTGKYFISVSLAATSTAGVSRVISFDIYKNNGTTRLPHIHSHRFFSGGGSDIGSVALSGISDLTVGDTIEIWLHNETNTTSIIVEDVNMSLMQVGG